VRGRARYHERSNYRSAIHSRSVPRATVHPSCWRYRRVGACRAPLHRGAIGYRPRLTHPHRWPRRAGGNGLDTPLGADPRCGPHGGLIGLGVSGADRRTAAARPGPGATARRPARGVRHGGAHALAPSALAPRRLPRALRGRAGSNTWSLSLLLLLHARAGSSARPRTDGGTSQGGSREGPSSAAAAHALPRHGQQQDQDADDRCGATARCGRSGRLKRCV
jgi:hypothetical protein